jgi:hypothetical protein
MAADFLGSLGHIPARRALSGVLKPLFPPARAPSRRSLQLGPMSVVTATVFSGHGRDREVARSNLRVSPTVLQSPVRAEEVPLQATQNYTRHILKTASNKFQNWRSLQISAKSGLSTKTAEAVLSSKALQDLRCYSRKLLRLSGGASEQYSERSGRHQIPQIGRRAET